jgi:hypothetical protein
MPEQAGIFARLFGPQRGTRKMLAVSGVWVTHEDLEGGDAQAGSLPAAPALRYLRRCEPGAPLPDEVAPDAPRFEVVVHNTMPQRVRRRVAAAGAALMLSTALTLPMGVHWGIITLLAGATLVAVGTTGGSERVTFRRSDEGHWVEVEAEAELPPAEPLPVFGRWERVVYGVLSAAILGLAATGRITGNLPLIGVVGVGLAVAAVWDSLPIRRRDPRNAVLADLRFHELADPSRPLTPEDVGLPLRAGDRPDRPALRQEV